MVVVPPEVEGDETLLKALLPLTDVMAAGHHAAVSANVQAGARVAVIGDRAVGLCAEPTIVLGHQSEQMALTSTGTSLRHPVL
jgi:threonine dehydrogenase-like Zn-dependent dehydrogenase